MHRTLLTMMTMIEGLRGIPYGPVPHSSQQSSNSMCFRTQRSTIGHRPAPYPNVYHQERSSAPIYNGSISGGVNNLFMSSGDGKLGSFPITSFINTISQCSAAIREGSCGNWGHARLKRALPSPSMPPRNKGSRHLSCARLVWVPKETG